MSVDYDPQKAHEYYEKHKKLKGRHSTSGFSSSQKEQFAYAKQQLLQQKKDRNATNAANINAQKQASVTQIEEAKKAQKEQLSNAAKAKIDQLRAQLKGMSKIQKAQAKSRIQGRCAWTSRSRRGGRRARGSRIPSRQTYGGRSRYR